MKPPKGTNVGDTEIISTLFGEDVPRTNLENDQKNDFNFMLERIIEKINNSTDSDSDISKCTANSEALKRFPGYVAFKFVKGTECTDCKATLLATSEEEIQEMKLILLQDKYNALYYPSKTLVNLVAVVEKHVLELEIARPGSVKKNLIFEIADSIFEKEEISSLGCSTSTHRFILTKSILNFLLTVRTFFVLRTVNKNCIENAKTKKNRK